ncbi:uncharacterized protein LOC120354108 [Nilaparvata lugens]|uniref:uncharacterized protein LOC120354108 n=1 Tax=Nilaparvata lugens TaxID=108931 RepID=UPI00193E83BC|nr:uncharacterized protein LOC120354108 [Nilaparvata lugens]
MMIFLSSSTYQQLFIFIWLLNHQLYSTTANTVETGAGKNISIIIIISTIIYIYMAANSQLYSTIAKTDGDDELRKLELEKAVSTVKNARNMNGACTLYVRTHARNSIAYDFWIRV